MFLFYVQWQIWSADHQFTNPFKDVDKKNQTYRFCRIQDCMKLSTLPVLPVGWLEQTLMIQTKNKTLWEFIAVFYFHIPVQGSLKSLTKGENSYGLCKPCIIYHGEKKIEFCKNICLKNVELKELIKTLKFVYVFSKITGNSSILI